MADPNARKDDDPDAKLPLSTPYGPHYRGVDEAAGGADSSPYENVETGGREGHAAAPPNDHRGAGKTLND